MSLSPEHQILLAVLLYSWVQFAWEAYLHKRQRSIYHSCLKVPPELDSIIDQDTFDKARRYSLDKSNFWALQHVVSQVISTAMVWFTGFKFVWDLSAEANAKMGLDSTSEIWTSVTFVLILNFFNNVVNLQFSIYSTFVIEERHGFNQQTAKFYIKDQMKKFFVSQVIALLVVAAIIKIIQVGGLYLGSNISTTTTESQSSFVYLWSFACAFTIFIIAVCLVLIHPLFDKYTPLPEGQLRKKIEDLAASMDFPLSKLFVIEGSKRSSHSNMYFYGFYKFKRIVLFDTLLEEYRGQKSKYKEDKEYGEEKEHEAIKKGFTIEEILAMLGHELGHWKLNHVLKSMIISVVRVFLMFALFAYLYKYQVLYAAFGFPSKKPILIGLIIILQFIAAPFNCLYGFSMTCLSRRFEFQADSFAVGLGRAEHLKVALVKLHNDNLDYPIYDWLYSAWYLSHPPLLERLNAFDKEG